MSHLTSLHTYSELYSSSTTVLRTGYSTHRKTLDKLLKQPETHIINNLEVAYGFLGSPDDYEAGIGHLIVLCVQSIFST